MTLAECEAEIQRLSARRCAIWSGAEGAFGEVGKIAKLLERAFETKRHLQARAPRKEILARARVETELAKLMAGNNLKKGGT